MNEKIEKIDARSSYAEVGYVKVQINDWNSVMSDFKKLRSENAALKARWDIIWKMVNNDHYARIDVRRKMQALESGGSENDSGSPSNTKSHYKDITTESGGSEVKA